MRRSKKNENYISNKNNAICQSCGHLYFKVPNFDKIFLWGFSFRMSKIYVELCELPKDLEKEKENKFGEEKEGENANI